MYAGSFTGMRAITRRERAVGGQPVEHVLAHAREAGRVVHELVALDVVVRVRRGHVRLQPVGVLEVADRVERLRVELHRHRRLGHRDVALADAREVHVRVVGDVRREDLLDALEDRAARVRREAAAGATRPPWRPGRRCSRGSGCRRTRLPSAKPKRFSIATPSNQWSSRLPADLEQRGRHAHERAGEPVGQLTRDRQPVDRRLLVLAREAEPVIRARSCFRRRHSP